MQRAYRHSTVLLGYAIAVIGVGILVSTVARGGGPLALGVVVGVAFILVGIGRAYLAGAR